MNWTLPTPLLLFAGVVALLPLVAIVRRVTSTPRLVGGAFVPALAVIALVWLAWVAHWLVEQRWWTLRVPRVIGRSWLAMTLRVPLARWLMTPWGYPASIPPEMVAPSKMHFAARSTRVAVITGGTSITPAGW